MTKPNGIACNENLRKTVAEVRSKARLLRLESGDWEYLADAIEKAAVAIEPGSNLEKLIMLLIELSSKATQS